MCETGSGFITSLFRQYSSTRPGPDMLGAVLLKLVQQERLTVSEILLRRELRHMPED